MLEIIDLDVAHQKKSILTGLNLKLVKGEVFGVLGMNGAGKTTLFNTIYGLQLKDRGEIKLDGIKLSHTNASYLETQNYFFLI